MLFLQAAGADFNKANEFAEAVAEIVRARIGEGPSPQSIAERIERVGWKPPENLLVAIAVHVTLASSTGNIDIDWIASAASLIGSPSLLLEAAGVAFAFNTVNRIADARRVKLEFRFLRELKLIQGWVERRLASLAGVVYDLSYRHEPRHSPQELRNRVSVLFERLGVSATPDLFNWLRQSPVVCEGIIDLVEACIMSAGIRLDLLKEAVAIALASQAMPGSGLRRTADEILSRGSFPDAKTLLSLADPYANASDGELVSACRRYSWRVANAAYKITDEQIRQLSALGLSNAEILDLTLAAAAFSALAIIEPISLAATERGL